MLVQQVRVADASLRRRRAKLLATGRSHRRRSASQGQQGALLDSASRLASIIAFY